VKIGAPLFRLSHHRMAAVAARAEALGFESVWIPEHLVFPTRITSRYPYSADGIPPVRVDAPLLDPLVLLTHVAAATRTIRLGTNVYLLGLRHPLVAARLATSVDVLSGGRLTLGVGIGWLEEEFQAVGVDFRTRAARTRECVRALRTLWTEPEPEFHGRFFSFGPVRFEPKPVQQPHPPLVFGGESEAALRRAAALGDGWYGVGHSPASAAAQVGRLRALLAAAGRGDAPFEMTVSHAAARLDRDEVARYAEAGVDRIVVLPWRRGRDAEPELERLADAVLRRVSYPDG
jgi:probable F420-dependent oxidoreductase